MDTNHNVLDNNEYPRRWPQYVGQEPAKRMLQLAAKSARLRREPLDHVLIAHPTPGIGKTALAVLLATELRSNCRAVSGQVSRDKARIALSTMTDGDVLFYDEFHQVMDAGRKNAEWLLQYLQDGMIAGPLGMEAQPRVTVVAATTDAHRLPENIVSRFPLQPLMQDYTAEEAAKIVRHIAKTLLDGLPPLRPQDAHALAVAAHRNPRAIRRLLTVLRDATITDELALVGGGRYDIPGLLAFQGITPDGLDPIAQRYLRTLGEEFSGAAGAKAIQDRLQHPGGLATVERVLMDLGLLAKTRAGRSLTQAGIRRYNDLVAD